MAGNQPENQEVVVPATGAVQIPRELPFIYRWVSNDVLGTPSSLDQQYLDELKLSGVLFGGGDLERRYRVEAARRGERRLLNRASVAPSQLHPNSWSSIRCFELVTEFLELPQDPEVFLYLFKLYSSNTSGKTKKGYMSVRPGKYRKIFALYEDSFHDFKVEMAGNDVTLARLRRLIRPAPAKSVPTPSTVVPPGGARSVPAESAGKTQVDPEGGSSTNVEHAGEQHVEVSSPGEGGIPLPPPPSPKRRRAEVEDASGSKRSRTLGGGSRDFCALDRSFDASGFVESHLLGPKAQEVLRDCDPLESVRWAEWAMIRDATIMKSVEPRLSIAEEVERRNARLLADAKTLNLQKMVLEEEKGDEVRARLKAEEDLKAAKAELE
ncbi:hypothetical protein PIB30_060974, partial [Stylosanthes scabra]|nr:hypothetical protein [Stylosanthes scabra]